MLRPKSGGRYIDGTVGAGGHAAGILQRSAPEGRLLAFDRDRSALDYAAEQLAPYAARTTFVHASYAEMAVVAPAHGFDLVDGILLDLGLSSRQLAAEQRGFSFMLDGPLDMRFDVTRGVTAADLVNRLSEAEIADLLWQYGEERRSRRIARAIVQHRPVRTTHELADLVVQTVGRHGGKHPATRVFQALRIAVNDELGALEIGLAAALKLLRPGGRLAVISFHSLEDRLVKQTFRTWQKDCVCPPSQPICNCEKVAEAVLVTRGAVMPSPEEVAKNPRSRSARLRVVQRLADDD